MSILLLIVAGITGGILGAAAQGTNAICDTGFSWMTNSRGQSPCLVSSYLFTPCSAPAASWVYPLSPGFHYNTPLDDPTSATPCRCNTVLFSMIAACATCQGQEEFIVPWSSYQQNCSTVYLQQYPENIPVGTSIPAWAYLDITANNTFNPVAAEAASAENIPESSVSGTPSSTSNEATLTAPPTETSGADGGPNSGSVGPSKKSNAGPIAGGVVGAVVGLIVIGILLFFLSRHRRSARRNQPTGPVDLTADSNYGQYNQYANHYGEAHYSDKSPGAAPDSAQSVKTEARFYDPNDPSTFPTPEPYAASARASSAGYPIGDQPSIGTNQNSNYRGAPEL